MSIKMSTVCTLVAGAVVVTNPFVAVGWLGLAAAHYAIDKSQSVTVDCGVEALAKVVLGMNVVEALDYLQSIDPDKSADESQSRACDMYAKLIALYPQHRFEQ